MPATEGVDLRAGLIFWQNMVSPHQSALMRSLAERAPGALTVIAEGEVSAERRNLGWNTPDYGRARLVIAPSAAERELLEEELCQGGVHIFSGIGTYPGTTASMRRIVARRTETVGVFLEPWDPGGWRGYLREAKYRLAARRYRRDIAILLTTGPLGRRQYSSVGFDPRTVVDYGYFVPPRDAPSSNELVELLGPLSSALRVAYVGSLSARKRVDVLLRALSMVRNQDWRLDVIGDGPERRHLTDLAAWHRLDDRIAWCGVLDNEAARTVLAAADVLVLPSRFDGWGAVVNEALLAGARVLVSDRCGAQEIAVAGGGAVFPSGDHVALSRLLAMHLARGRVDAQERERRRGWARTVISPEAAADHLLESLRCRIGGVTAPLPPWRSGAFLE